MTAKHMLCMNGTVLCKQASNLILIIRCHNAYNDSTFEIPKNTLKQNSKSIRNETTILFVNTKVQFMDLNPLSWFYYANRRQQICSNIAQFR